MSYRTAVKILPNNLLKQIQEYVDGECIYIPIKSENKKEWGTKTTTRLELDNRNKEIYEAYLKGISARYLGEKYFLSVKSIQRIIREEKSANEP